ncbi:acyl-CoA N-acyltransferase [Cubamyces menziesii]|uniref:N-acetyltransferase domain-containing protein n=1 Tax=Trametes cubensis TaxID=1111947 RepID=A0AAD7X7M8_9APHY|nr:acyl-CoA N-acyltransferase [Cubamyces menziesii]KAJ8463623.1 hypothetical protein ONZ51_g10138 [Trametes cubensis]
MDEDTPGAAAFVYDIFTIPAPPTSADTIRYKNTRLTALRTDPSCFSSTYAREAVFTEETWRERLNGDGKAVFVVRAAKPPSRSGEGRTEGEHEGAPFIGTASVVAARALPSATIPNGVDREATYFVFGMWVDPDHRGRGVGRKLLEAGVQWVAEDATKAALRDGQVVDGSHIVAEMFLTVAASNQGARRMYERCGFETMPAEMEGGGTERREVWLRRRIAGSDCTR